MWLHFKAFCYSILGENVSFTWKSTSNFFFQNFIIFSHWDISVSKKKVYRSMSRIVTQSNVKCTYIDSWPVPHSFFVEGLVDLSLNLYDTQKPPKYGMHMTVQLGKLLVYYVKMAIPAYLDQGLKSNRNLIDWCVTWHGRAHLQHRFGLFCVWNEGDARMYDAEQHSGGTRALEMQRVWTVN